MKIPQFSCIILTTIDELERFSEFEKRFADIIEYSKTDDMEGFMIRVLAAYRVNYKQKYYDLLFSVDPGTKHIGLAIFLDDFFLNSHILYERDDLLKVTKTYVENLQKNNLSLLNLSFKFGRGLPMTRELVKKMFDTFNKQENVRMFLVDEHKSSKIKISSKKRDKKISKDEVSAVILALRDGIEVSRTNYQSIFDQIKNKRLKKEDLKVFNGFDVGNVQTFFSTLGDVAKMVLEGEISVSEASEMMTKLKNDK